MNFAAIQNQLGNYETSEDSSPLSVNLEQIISKFGLEIFGDKEELIRQIDQTALSPKIKSQFALIIRSSELPSFILNSKADLNMIDINNAVHNVVLTTGLSYDSAIVIIADTFYACGMKFSIEFGPVLSGNLIENKLHAVMPSASVEQEVKKATKLYESYQKKNTATSEKDEAALKAEADDVLRIIQRLCASGVSEGFYLLGLCYLNGTCNTSKDTERAFELMKIAAEMGNTAAASYLGDFYYKTDEFLERDYTLAHYYYTRPGALSIGKERRQALQDIYTQKGENQITFLFSFISVILTICFVRYFHTGIFSGSGRLAAGIIASILSAAALVLAFLYHRSKPFNGIRWLLVIQYFIWAIYSFILLLA